MNDDACPKGHGLNSSRELHPSISEGEGRVLSTLELYKANPYDPRWVVQVKKSSILDPELK